MSWNPEVKVDGEWSGNGLFFVTEEEAKAWAEGLLQRWWVSTDARAVESDRPVNYRLLPDGKIEALDAVKAGA